MSYPSSPMTDYRQTRGAARLRLDPDAYVRFLDAGVLVTDASRSLPLPFDGRFFAADDWRREQNYFLKRQADFGRAVGSGIAYGLTVEPGPSATTLDINPGHGLTAAGELVLLDEKVTVDVANLARMLDLAQRLGLSRYPKHPQRTRSGLFVLALRPVEYTANAVSSYPKSLGGSRQLEDGDIIEAMVVTLVPFPDPGSIHEGERRRSRVAKNLFVERRGELELPEALPLAMVALRRGIVDWIDPWMVRRELGTDREDVLGLNLGTGRRSGRLAYLHQYHEQLQYIQALRGETAAPFAASEYFDALPPCGRMPKSGIDSQDLAHHYFPITMDVRLTVIPDDELPIVIEEAMRLPPIDLSASEDAMRATSVLVLVPTSRSEFGSLRGALEPAASFQLTSKVAAVSAIQPVERLRLMTGGTETTALAAPIVLADKAERIAAVAWGNTVARTPELWYARVRTRHEATLPVAESVAVIGDELGDEKRLVQYLKASNLYEQFHHLKTKASAEADLSMVELLAAPAFTQSKTLAAGPIYELQQKKKLSKVAVANVAERYQDPTLGEGLVLLEQDNPRLTSDEAARLIGKTLQVRELDAVSASLSGAERKKLADGLARVVSTGSQTQVKEYLGGYLKGKVR